MTSIGASNDNASILAEWAGRVISGIESGETAGALSRVLPNGKRYILIDYETYGNELKRRFERGQAAPTSQMKELCKAAEEVQAAYEEWIDALPDSEAERGASVRIDFAHIGLRTALEKAKGKRREKA